MTPNLSRYPTVSIETDLDDLALEPLCRTACAVLAVPAAAILISGRSHRWCHAIDDTHHQIIATIPIADGVPGRAWHNAATDRPHVVASVSFGPGDAGILLVIDTAPRHLTADDHARLADLGRIAGRILALHHDRHRLSQDRNFYQMLADASTDTIVRGNLDGVRLYVSPSVRDLIGYEPHELTGRKAVDVTHPDDLRAFGAMMAEVREGRLDVAVMELRQRHKDGPWIWMEASLRLTRDKATGAPDGYVVSVRGIDRRKELEARLEWMAGHDILTGLPNRAMFQRYLQDRIDAARPIALLYMDLDGFKQVNDRLGHHAGDAVLRDMARRLTPLFQDTDLVARLGGDEFAAIIDLDGRNLARLCECLIDATTPPFIIDGTEATIGLSIGIAICADSHVDPEALLSRADAALYAAKLAGKNTFRFERPGNPT